MRGSDPPHAEIIFHQAGQVRDVSGVVGKEVKSALDQIDICAEILFGRADNLFDFAVRASRDQDDSLFRFQRERQLRETRGRDVRARSGGRR
jgi:hypothetical protein